MRLPASIHCGLLIFHFLSIVVVFLQHSLITTIVCLLSHYKNGTPEEAHYQR